MKDNTPLVSVIIPTYNRVRVLPRAMESVLNQTYQNIELIIVDDGSPDNTEEIVSGYCNKDKRVIYLKNNKNERQSYSINRGIEQSRGDFLGILDDDCEYVPEKIEKQMTLMQTLSPAPSFIYSNMWIEWKGAATMLAEDLKSKLLSQKDIFSCKYNFLDPGTWLCSKACIKRIGGYDNSLLAYNDIDLLTRVLVSGEGIYFVNIPLSIKHREEGVSSLSLRFISQKEDFLKKHTLLLRKHKKYLSRFYYGLGKDLLSLKEKRKAKEYFWKAFLCDPFKIKYLFKG